MFLRPVDQLGLIAVFCALVLSAPGHAESVYVPLKQLPELVGARPLLQDLADERGHTRTNHFCVLGKKFGSGGVADVFWAEENKIILWEPRNPGVMNRLVFSRRYLDLKRDVVDDPGTSTYLLQRSEVDREVKACAKMGDHFVVERLVRARGALGRLLGENVVRVS